MSLTTDDLRRALSDAADAPYDAAGAARMHGVRSRVQQARRRRTAVVSGVGALAVATVVGAVTFGGAGTTPPPASLPASASPTTGSPASELPTTWGVRDVVGSLTGSGTDTPARLVAWPSGVTGILARCDGTDAGLVVTLERTSGATASSTVPCVGRSEAYQVVDVPSAAASIREGEQVRVQVRLDRPTAGTPVGFGAGLLVGRDEIDLSTLRTAGAGWTSAGAYAMADGWQYSAYAPDGTARGTAITNGVQIALADQQRVRLQVRCWSGVRLEVDPGASGEATSVTCPAGRRTTTSLDVDLRPAKDQRLTLRAVDAVPGGLVEVGVSTR